MAGSYETASSACGNLCSVRSQNKNPVTFAVWQFGVPVLKHHDTFPGYLKSYGIALGVVQRNGFILDIFVEKAETVECAEYMIYFSVDILLPYNSRFNQRNELRRLQRKS